MNTKLPEPFKPEKATPQKQKASVFENETALKKAFAAFLLKCPEDPYRAALAVIDTSKDAGPAMLAANLWPNDAIVKAEMARLLEEKGEFAFLPSKVELARSIWERAHRDGTEDADAVKLLKLYAEVMDFIPKPGAKSNVGQVVNISTYKEDSGL